ncbi:MAG: DUF523 domain-containing protein [Candidatus Aenigmatarchaeota archaeon]
MIVVSACLAGVGCSHDGRARTCSKVAALVKSGGAIPVCPEILGGFGVPRDCIEIRDGRAVTESGKDVTENIRRGADEALRIAKRAGCRCAILKARSPSCGSGRIYDGTFCGMLVPGDGIFARLLLENGIKVEAGDADRPRGKL